jgi:NTP pyrophosphatase (non-canonical NTP hydrolase)
MVSWLSTMASKVAVQNAQYRDLGPGQTLSEIVWHKYPGVCYYCGQAECVCLLLDVDRIKDTSTPEQLKEHKKWLEGVLGRARNQGERPKSIDQWVDMLDRIYGGANRSRTSAEKTFHLLEEIGEVEQELRAADRSLTGAYPARPIGWEEEVADVFSWIVAVFCHIRRSIARTNGYAEAYARATGLGLEGNLLNRRPVISELLWFEFGDPEVGLTCHRCHKTRCDMTLCPNESHESCRGIDNSDLPPGAFRIPPRR